MTAARRAVAMAVLLVVVAVGCSAEPPAEQASTGAAGAGTSTTAGNRADPGVTTTTWSPVYGPCVGELWYEPPPSLSTDEAAQIRARQVELQRSVFEDLRALDVERDRWEDRRFEAYDLEYSIGVAMQQAASFRIRVEVGGFERGTDPQVLDSELLENDANVPTDHNPNAAPRSVDGLFDLVETFVLAQCDFVCTTSHEPDPDLGYPRRARLDCGRSGGYGFTVERLEPASG